MEPREITTRSAVLSLEEGGIIRATALPVHVTLADAKELIDATILLGEGTPRPVLVDLRKQRSCARDAREYFASPAAARGHCALALLVDSLVSKTIGNFFISFNRVPVPIHMFRLENEALLWLRGFLK